MGNCPKMQFASFGVSFRALSGASRDASEEVLFSAPADVWEKSTSFQEIHGAIDERQWE